MLYECQWYKNKNKNKHSIFCLNKHSIKGGKSFAIKYWFPCRVMKCPARVQIHNSTDSQFNVLVNDEHDHVYAEENDPIRTPMSDLVKTKIEELYR